MNLNTKVIFTTEESIKIAFIQKFDLKNSLTNSFEIYKGKIEIEEFMENIVLVYSKSDDLINSLNYVRENYLVTKYILVGFSYIIRNQDLESGDIMIPNSFLNTTGEDAVFLDYAVGENYDLNIFGLILNGICIETGENKIENLDSEFAGDIKDADSYKFLKNLRSEEKENVLIIRLCIKSEEEKENNFFIDNLLNITEIMF